METATAGIVEGSCGANVVRTVRSTNAIDVFDDLLLTVVGFHGVHCIDRAGGGFTWSGQAVPYVSLWLPVHKDVTSEARPVVFKRRPPYQSVGEVGTWVSRVWSGSTEPAAAPSNRTIEYRFHYTTPPQPRVNAPLALVQAQCTRAATAAEELADSKLSRVGFAKFTKPYRADSLLSKIVRQKDKLIYYSHQRALLTTRRSHSDHN